MLLRNDPNRHIFITFRNLSVARLIPKADAELCDIFCVVLPGRIGEALRIAVLQTHMTEVLHDISTASSELDCVVVAARLLKFLQLAIVACIKETRPNWAFFECLTLPCDDSRKFAEVVIRVLIYGAHSGFLPLYGQTTRRKIIPSPIGP